MAYNTDGSSHKTGIRAEKNISDKLESDISYKNEVCPSIGSNYSVNRKGGTKFKEDVVVVDNLTKQKIKLSIKKKKSLKVGSFDYVNSSSAIKSDSDFDKIKKVSKNIRKNKPNKSTARRQFNEASHRTMKRMSSKLIKKILIENVAIPNADKRILMRDKTSGTDYVYNFVDDPLYTAITTMDPSFSWGRGKTSAKIIFKDKNGNEYDYGLRGRLVSNNGITAMIGKSSNKSSIPVFKVQQDGVGKIIKRIPKDKITIIKI